MLLKTKSSVAICNMMYSGLHPHSQSNIPCQSICELTLLWKTLQKIRLETLFVGNRGHLGKRSSQNTLLFMETLRCCNGTDTTSMDNKLNIYVSLTSKGKAKKKGNNFCYFKQCSVSQETTVVSLDWLVI